MAEPVAPRRPSSSVYSCCGRRVADGHPRWCRPQVKSAVALAAWVVFMAVVITLIATA